MALQKCRRIGRGSWGLYMLCWSQGRAFGGWVPAFPGYVPNMAIYKSKTDLVLLEVNTTPIPESTALWDWITCDRLGETEGDVWILWKKQTSGLWREILPPRDVWLWIINRQVLLLNGLLSRKDMSGQNYHWTLHSSSQIDILTIV